MDFPSGKLNKLIGVGHLSGTKFSIHFHWSQWNVHWKFTDTRNQMAKFVVQCACAWYIIRILYILYGSESLLAASHHTTPIYTMHKKNETSCWSWRNCISHLTNGHLRQNVNQSRNIERDLNKNQLSICLIKSNKNPICKRNATLK